MCLVSFVAMSRFRIFLVVRCFRLSHAGYVQTGVAQYQADPANQWRTKDAVITMVLALTVKAQTRAYGVSEVNTLISVNDFYAAHILPELQAPDVDALPVLKADAVKFASTHNIRISITTEVRLFDSQLV